MLFFFATLAHITNSGSRRRLTATSTLSAGATAVANHESLDDTPLYKRNKVLKEGRRDAIQEMNTTLEALNIRASVLT